MSDIYDQHQTAFASVSAFVILDGQGERVATVALKFPRDGAGRLFAYVHIIGLQMVRAYAGGYGYDKRSAAVSSALVKVEAIAREARRDWPTVQICDHAERLKEAAADMGSRDWTRAIEARGYRVIQAV